MPEFMSGRFRVGVVRQNDSADAGGTDERIPGTVGDIHIVDFERSGV